MITDTDLIGIIAASCIMFLIIIGLTVLVAITCHKRLERMKREQIATNAMLCHIQHEPAEIIHQVHSAGSLSDTTSNDPLRMSNYREMNNVNREIEGRLLSRLLEIRRGDSTSNERPRILHENEGTSLNDYPSRDSSTETETRKWRNNKHRQSREKTDDTEVRRAVSIIQVNSRDVKVHGRPEVKANGQVVEGYVTVPHSTSHDITNKVLYRQSPEQGNVQTVHYNTLAHTADSVSTSGGDIVRGRIIKQNVSMAADGKLVITSSDEREASDSVSNHNPQTNQESSLVTPGDADFLSTYTARRDLEIEDSFRRGSLGSCEREYIESIEDVTRTTHASDYYVNGGILENIGTGISNTAQTYDTANNVETYQRRDDHNIKRSRVVTDWEYDSDESEDSFSNKEQKSQIVTVIETHDSNADIQNSTHQTEESDRISKEVDDDVTSKRQEDSISLFYSDTNNYKVIKKHSAHKPPDWLVKTYAESAASVDQTESSTQVVQTVETSIVTTDSTSAFRKEGQRVSFADMSSLIQDNADHYAMMHPEPDYPNEAETLTITDYVDPNSGAVSRAINRLYSGVQNTEDGIVITTKSVTATAMRQLRQQANDAQEKPSTSLRVPKAPWEIEQSEDTESQSDLSLITVRS